MLVEFSIVPLGKGASVGEDVARVIRIVEKSGLPYKLNPMGTVVEGDWDSIMNLIKKCHKSVMRGGERVVTTVKIDDRKGRRNMIESKIKSVEKRIGRPVSK
jgi:uncharacterized protein (TIGR00106 family)